jgi:hypothetical protein
LAALFRLPSVSARFHRQIGGGNGNADANGHQRAAEADGNANGHRRAADADSNADGQRDSDHANFNGDARSNDGNAADGDIHGSLGSTNPRSADAHVDSYDYAARQRVVISESCLRRRTDWNGDGSVDTRDEWIELANLGGGAVDVGGWSLDNSGRGNYVIPIGTVLQPQQYFVFFGGQTGLNLSDEGGQVRLRSADGQTVDRVRYDAIPSDGSYSRDDAGNWHADWSPSPGAPNGQLGNVTAQAKQPSLGTSEAALLSILEKMITTIKELIFGFFR